MKMTKTHRCFHRDSATFDLFCDVVFVNLCNQMPNLEGYSTGGAPSSRHGEAVRAPGGKISQLTVLTVSLDVQMDVPGLKRF